MDSILSTIQHYAGILKGKALGTLDAILPPEKRAELLEKLQSFAVNNPKLAFFLVTHLVLTGIPLGLFILFSVVVFVVALLVSLIVALLGAILFTVFMLGVALVVVLPTLFFTTMAATFLTLWGLGGYYLIQWFNGGEIPGAPGQTIGDALSSLTGGKLDGMMQSARENVNAQNTGIGAVSGGEKKDKKEKGEESGAANGQAEGGQSTKGKTTGAAMNGGQNAQQTAAGGAQDGPRKIRQTGGGATE